MTSTRLPSSHDSDATTVGDGTLPVRNPRTGRVDHLIRPPAPAEVTRVCAGLRTAQPAWSAAGIDHRAAMLRRWADAIEANAATIGDAETVDTGRSRVSHEVPYMVASSIRGWCDAAPAIIEGARLHGVSSTSSTVSYDTEFDPYALLGVMSPWNHPFLLATLDAVPALLAGCAVIVKPSEVTPRFVEPVTATIAEVPELAAVLQFVAGGPETGRAIVDEVDALCFTGGVPTGRAVAETCARRFIPAFLELGGKDAAVVTASADLQRAAAAVLKGAVHNAGQVCFATERVYVDRSVHDAFVEELTAQARRLELNHPDVERGHIGPFIHARQADIVDEHLADALARGAVLHCGGHSETLDGGRYMRATVLTGVDHDMKIMHEETFGPVVPVQAYDGVDEAIRLANDSAYGLSAAVIAGDEEEARAIGRRISAGAVSLMDTSLTITIMRDVEKTSYNASGLGGSRMGPNGMLRFLRRKALLTRSGPVPDMDSLREDAAPQQ
ncbi:MULTISPECIES: aldehyde dehydrogenase family protein [unclassified Streptomyces]|uniref:Aldehyde dehydrogenase family protein n=1 Tax=Streptomyces rhizosphaericus TaxID=114699 RepID=A0A6G4AJJ3_9ACTN|nr:aldehyde dehydrogenase family protein [Streptomyces sp. PRh5]EXU64130.1 aldehyde dehydrogenase [Streptomyces sp. PRh5]NEW72667.1 aldehyde dehydrogenase family protein [Streptomyces rhizosphaericus]